MQSGFEGTEEIGYHACDVIGLVERGVDGAKRAIKEHFAN